MEFSVELYKYLSKTKTLIPYFEKGIQAGFPSPASDYMEQAIDLNKTLIKRNPTPKILIKCVFLQMDAYRHCFTLTMELFNKLQAPRNLVSLLNEIGAEI